MIGRALRAILALAIAAVLAGSVVSRREADVDEPHHSRIQGPTFLVEYDNTRNGANHIHSVWRDFDGDFGRDLPREHHRSAGPSHGP